MVAKRSKSIRRAIKVASGKEEKARRRVGVLTHRPRSQKVVERAHIGPLRSLLVKPRTLERYAEALRRFSSWVRQNGWLAPKRAEDVDRLLACFVETLWECGDPRAHGDDAVSGMIFRAPQLRGCLPDAKRLLKAWARAEIPNRAPPFSVAMLYALVAWSLSMGFKDTAFFLLLGWLLQAGRIVVCPGR